MEEPEANGNEKLAVLGNCLHGDVLQYNIISRLFTIDLLPASRVSKTWRAAVLSSFRCPPPPSLVIHFQRRYGSQNISSVAYNPFSNSWQNVVDVSANPFEPQPSAPICAAYTGQGSRLCELSASKFALATDTFGKARQVIAAPRLWRTEPLVAVVGSYVVLAGGVNEYEDGPQNAVEVHCIDDSVVDGWETCEPMPEVFGWTGSVSVATNERRVYAIEKQSPWWVSWFDPKTKSWNPTRQLNLPVRFAAIGFLNGQLIVVGVAGTGMDYAFRPTSVHFWSLDEETMEVVEEKEAWRMPQEMVAGLLLVDDEGGWSEMRSIGFLTHGKFGYIYNPSQTRAFFLFELRSKNRTECCDQCRWERVEPPAALEDKLPLHRAIIGCSVVGINGRLEARG